MSQSEPYRVGIGDSVDEGFAAGLINALTVPARGLILDNINTVDFANYDALLLVNPEFEYEKIDEFVHALEGGVTALILLNPAKAGFDKIQRLCQRLGYEMTGSRPSDKVKYEYTADYPVPAKRGHSDEMTYARKRSWITYNPLSTNYPRVRQTIIARRSLLGKEAMAVLVETGEGMAILFDSTSRESDRNEMFAHLLANSKRRGTYRSAGWAEEAKLGLPAVVASLFQVYDEVPFGLLAERAGLDLNKIDHRMFMEILESLVREHRIAARIRKDCLVKQ